MNQRGDRSWETRCDISGMARAALVCNMTEATGLDARSLSSDSSGRLTKGVSVFERGGLETRRGTRERHRDSGMTKMGT